jgi:hypothetical protein
MAHVVNPQPATPHNEALYEAGKKLLIDSVDVGREFCKTMITTCFSAIPIYLSLLQLGLPKGYQGDLRTGIVFVIPAIFYLLGAVLAVIGYMPSVGSFSLDLPEEIEAQRAAIIARRRVYGHWSLGALTAGVLAGTAIVVSAFALPAPAGGR